MVNSQVIESAWPIASQRKKSTNDESLIVMEAISYARPEFQRKAAGHVPTATAKT